MISGLVAVLVALAVVLGGPFASRLLDRDVTLPPTRGTSGEEQSLLARLRYPLSGLAVVGGWTVLGGVVGVLLGLVGGVLSWRALSRLESPAARRRRQELERDLPVAVHLVGACLAAGSSVDRALEVVAGSMSGSISEELALVLRRLRWGLDPATVWRDMEGPLEPLGRSMARAHESGASVRQAVVRLAEDLRAGVQVRAASRARTIEVRAAAPLGLCFLPAFALLGVVPMAAGLFSSLGLFG